MVSGLPSSTLTKEKEQQQFRSGIKRRQTPTIYEVTTGSLSEATKATYTRYINDFLAFYKITDLKDIEPWKERYSPKLIRQMVLDFVIYLRDRDCGLSRSTIKLYCAALSHFFYMIRDDDTHLNWTKVRMEFPPDERIRKDRHYTKEEIQKILGVCSRIRDKVIILLLVSTGMRIGGIHSLTWRDLTPKTTPQGKVYKIEVYSGSSASYYCYCNIETANTIDEYLNERTDNGEVLLSDTPLIRNLKTLNVKNVKPLTDYSVKYTVGKIIRRSGIKNSFQFTGEAKLSKGFRKFYKTEAESSGMKPAHVEMTHGHSIGMSDHYYRPQEFEVLSDYMTHAADALTIDPTKKLQQKINDLEGQQTEEIDRLKSQLQRYKDEQSRAQDTSMESIRELRKRLDATEDKHEKALLALEHARKTLIHYDDDEKHKHT